MNIKKSSINRKYGWKRSLPNFKLKCYRNEMPHEIIPIADLPVSVDLRSKCLPVYDQGELGSCSANAIAGAIEFLQPGFMASRLFIYFNERSIEGTVSSDSGAQITDGIDSVMSTGVCPETDWPYDISQFTVTPPANCFTNAKNDVLSQYLTINGIQEMKSCLAQGYPFVFGFTVYESLESDSVAGTGLVPMPSNKEECLGGHAVLAVGYDSNKKLFTIKNSWGPSWGNGGFFYLPEAYIGNESLASECITLRK